MTKVAHLNSVHFFSLAREAYKRSLSSATETIVAVVFSALAIEAFLNDMVVIAEVAGSVLDKGGLLEAGERIRLFASIMGKLEEQRAPIKTKVQMTHLILKGSHLNTGGQPYQDFDLLVDLRNILVHSKPLKYDFLVGDSNTQYKPRPVIERLSARGVIPRPASDDVPALMIYVRKPEVAHWAYDTAIQMANYLIELLPSGEFKDSLSQLVKAGTDGQSMVC